MLNSYRYEITWQITGMSVIEPAEADIDAAVADGVDVWQETDVYNWMCKNRPALFLDLVDNFDERDAQATVIDTMVCGEPPEKFWED